MAYLNEDGLETLVGKIKGQVIELTSAEYRQLDPAVKNYDNKLYFVSDEAYAYQIDDEPTENSSGLVKSGGVYNWTSKIGSGSLTTTAQTLIPAVNELDAEVDELKNGLTDLNDDIENLFDLNPVVLNSSGAYSDGTLYSILKADERITKNRFFFFVGQFTGGKRYGVCYLYDDTKLYGSILVFYYASSPRFLRVSDGTATLQSWATS